MDTKLVDELLSKLKTLENDFQSLTTASEKFKETALSASDLQRFINSKIDTTIEKIDQSKNDQSLLNDLEDINHDLLMDVLNTIKDQQVEFEGKIVNNLNVLSQHSAARKKLLSIIDEIVEINRMTETTTDYNTDYDELAKEIRQIIRSTPKLDIALRANS